MELIMYRKTLDVHKNGTQFLLQGFETADNLSRVVEISLMQSGDAIDFPLEKIIAMMYVTPPSATEPSIHECTIKDNKVVFVIPKISEEGITTMQLKLIETSTDGARSVLASPKFACEVIKSITDDKGVESTEEFTRFEDAIAKAKSVYDERFLRMELSSDCMFRAFYADGAVYETDVLKNLFHEGNSVLAESFAHGGTGVRTGEDTDNSMYYSNVSKSEALNAKAIMENNEEILDEVRLHGMYTAFSVDFETGDVEYVSPSFKFKVNLETGELDAEGQSYTFSEEIYRIVDEWLLTNNVKLKEIQALADRVTPIDKGGTAADNIEDARTNLGVYSKEEVCDPDILELFGLPEESIPKDVFESISTHKLNLEVRTYVGTGEYGSGSPNTLTFEHEPILCLITDGSRYLGMYVNGMTTMYCFSGGNKEGLMGAYGKYTTLTKSGTTLSWYSQNSDMGEADQFNTLNKKYTCYCLSIKEEGIEIVEVN